MRQWNLYKAIQGCKVDCGYPIDSACELLKVSRSAYYKWATQKLSQRELNNGHIAEKAEEIYVENPDMGYRRIRDDLFRNHDIKISKKKALRICRAKGLKSIIKYKNPGCTRRAENPQHIAANILNREFHADKPNEKWLTDVTEFKYYEGIVVHKVYLSAILDLYDRRIVAFAVKDRNDNQLVFDMFDRAVMANPDAHPLFHSDRGYQYTSRTFYQKLMQAGMTQSMSRVGRCIDNGPMEGFWGILKRERYYVRRFTDRETLVKMIRDYIEYYNTKRLQHNLGILTPMMKHELYLAA